MRGLRIALASACLGAALTIPSSAGAVTVLLGPPSLAASDSFASCDALSPSFCTSKTFIPTSLPEPGATLVTPTDGTIVSWRVRGVPPAKLKLRIVRAIGDGQFKGIATSGAAKVGDGASDTPAAIGIVAGDQLGINVENTPLTSTLTTLSGNANAPGAAWSGYFPGLADGATAGPTSTGTGSEPLFNATVVLAKPQIFGISSTSGPQTGGELVVLRGAHLAVATGILFGDALAQVVAAGNSQVMVATPPNAPGTVGVTLATAGGTSDPVPYTYTPVSPPAPDTSGPVLSAFSLAPFAFTAREGARISFRSDEAGSLRLRVERKPRRGPFKALPGTVGSEIAAGRNSLALPVRWNGKALARGRYRLLATATDRLGNVAKPKRRAFKVLSTGRRR